MKIIIKGTTPNKIPYMKKPPALGGVLEYLSHDEFKQKFKCEYFEGVAIKHGELSTATVNDFKNDARAKAAYERLMQPLDSLVIAEMSHDIGCGLFTLKDIPAGTVICIYSGEYNPDSRECVYTCSDIDAKNMGGFARFMQHQPISAKAHESYLLHGLSNEYLYAIQQNISEQEAKKLLTDKSHIKQAKEKIKKTIENNQRWTEYNFEDIQFLNQSLPYSTAQSNVFYEPVEVAGVEILLMVAMSDIEANESIGFSYGRTYFRHPQINSQPELFTKMGQVLHRETDYRYQKNTAFDNAFNSLFGNFPKKDSSEECLSGSGDDDSALSDEIDTSEKFNDTAELFANTEQNLARAMRLMRLAPNQTSSSTSSNVAFSEFGNYQQKLAYLLESTEAFFTKQPMSQWKQYPDDKLIGKYIGHQVHYFTMQETELEQTKKFVDALKKRGFFAELKNAKAKPSVLVDLTDSKINYAKKIK